MIHSSDKGEQISSMCINQGKSRQADRKTFLTFDVSEGNCTYRYRAGIMSNDDF